MSKFALGLGSKRNVCCLDKVEVYPLDLCDLGDFEFRFVQHQSHVSEDSCSFVTENTLFWRHSVRSSEIAAAHQRISDDLKTGEGVVITSRWIASIQASIGEASSRPMASQVLGKNLVMDDELRIRNDVEQGDMSDLDAFWSLLEHVRVVMPSAAKHILGKETKHSSSTLLTLPPSTLRRLGAGKVFDALNAGLRQILPQEDFLSNCADGRSTSWIDALVKATENSNAQIPIFTILLFRLEQAFREAYQASAETSVGEGSAEKPEGGTKLTRLEVDYRKFADKVARRIDEIEQLGIEEVEKAAILSELAKACGGADVKGIQLSDLFFTPLALLGRSLETDGIGSLAAVDDVINVALERIEYVTTKQPTPESAEETAVLAADPGQSAKAKNQDAAPQKNNAKKKRKKKPKKKVSYVETFYSYSSFDTFPNFTYLLQQGKGRGSDHTKSDAMVQQANLSEVVTSSADINGKQNAKSNNDLSNSRAIAAENNKEIETRAVEEAESVDTEESLKLDSGNAATLKTEVGTKEAKDTMSVPSTGSKDKPITQQPQLMDDTHDDGDTWETVEVKPRNQRKKGLDRSNTFSSRNSASNSSGMNDNSHKKSKDKRTSSSRRKNANRKMVRDILSSVVDSVEDESHRKQKLAAQPVSSENRWKKGPPLPGGDKQTSSASPNENNATRPKTLRDIVIGSGANSSRSTGGTLVASSLTRRGSNTGESGNKTYNTADQSKKRNPCDQSKKRVSSNPMDVVKKDVQSPSSRKRESVPQSPKQVSSEKVATKSGILLDSPTKQGSSKWSKGKLSVAADQNTAPTYQETVSAMSGNSNRLADRPAAKPNQVEPSTKSDSSSGDTDEAPQNRERAASPVEKESGSGPPLLTL